MSWHSRWVQATNGQQLLYSHIHGQRKDGGKGSGPHGRELSQDRMPSFTWTAKSDLRYTEIKASLLGYFKLTFLHFNDRCVLLTILWPDEPSDRSANSVSGFHSHKESRVNIQWLRAQKGCCFWQNEPEWFPKWYLFILKLCTQQMSGWADFSNPGTNGEVGW